MELFEEYSQLILGILGSVMSVFFSGFVWAVKSAWKAHRKEISCLSNSIANLRESHVEARNHQAKLTDITQGLRAEMHLATKSMDYAKMGLTALEGAIQQQQKTINQYVERIAMIDGQLAAVFKFVDAKRRSTDV